MSEDPHLEALESAYTRLGAGKKRRPHRLRKLSVWLSYAWSLYMLALFVELVNDGTPPAGLIILVIPAALPALCIHFIGRWTALSLFILAYPVYMVWYMLCDVGDHGFLHATHNWIFWFLILYGTIAFLVSFFPPKKTDEDTKSIPSDE